jgi:hypothetical protein
MSGSGFVDHSIDGSSSHVEHAGKLIGPLAAPSSSNDLSVVERLPSHARTPGAKPQISVPLIVRPEIDVDQLARLLLKMADESVDE